METLRTYWISWYQPTADYRPNTYPPNNAILGWHCTGQRLSDGANTIVAHVIAPSVAAAKEAVLVDWPEAREWRFCDLSEPTPPQSDRFPLPEWSVERYAKSEAARKEGE